MKLDVKAAAMTLALTWGLGLFLMTWWLIMWEGGSSEPIFLSRFYLGYRISPAGSFIGLGWALVDGWIGGFVMAWLYNRLARSNQAV
jgi:hypothetical protein